ncbi:hypothetical protein GTO89_16690 [Heliobacterium gestii]|uniref:DNA ligase (ATP) n=1 Tax=Heliomicrobium gestii TaxID=2699 RepID=A0A845LER5_HELGE|nr:hypothetical protein [Heliomicrobium gestii]MBM7868503.1 ATP-dependent DNA ligase [Heliomicrobium gestii]MZP44658.1 hypothetical protein [Heliomicrobium gestii]
MKRPIVPMEPLPHPEPFDHPDFLFQVKWDGIRALAFVIGSDITLQNRKGRDITRTYVDVASQPILRPGNSGIVDGELVVLDDTGKPSFPLILRREQARTEATIRRHTEQYPVRFMAFDLLELNGQALLAYPLHKRLALLQEYLAVSEQAFFTDSHLEEGAAFFHGVKALGLEGMVAKEKNSAYVFGKKHGAWKKIKNYREITCPVIGYTQTQPGRLASLVLGKADDEELTYIGRVSSGLTAKEAELWRQRLVPLPPEKEDRSAPRLKCGLGRKHGPGKPAYTPVFPNHFVHVRYLEWTPDLCLRHPSYLGAAENSKSP